MPKETVKRITTIGGQALIEGVMMRGPKKTSMAVRLPDGSIDLSTLSTPSLREKYTFWKLPFLRGIATFIDSLRVGFSALRRRNPGLRTTRSRANLTAGCRRNSETRS